LGELGEKIPPKAKKHPGKKPKPVADNPQIERELDELEADTYALGQPEGEVTPEADKQGDMLEGPRDEVVSEPVKAPEPKTKPTIKTRPLSQIMITEMVEIEETGKKEEILLPADELLADADGRISALEQLKECIRA